MTLFIFLAPIQRAIGPVNLMVVRIIWVIGILSITFGRMIGLEKRFGKLIPRIVLSFVVCYWGALAWTHQAALHDASQLANQISSARGEQFIRAAAKSDSPTGLLRAGRPYVSIRFREPE